MPRGLYRYMEIERPFKLDPHRVCVCSKCGNTEIRTPQLSMRCRVCGSRLHKTDKKY